MLFSECMVSELFPKSATAARTTLVIPTLNPSTWAKRPVCQEELFIVSVAAPFQVEAIGSYLAARGKILALG